MADQIRVLPDDVERDAHTGKHSGLRYRRFHIRSIDAWGVAKYSRVLEFAGRDAQVWIAKFLESQLAEMGADAARRWVQSNSPIHVPLAAADDD